MILKLQKRKKRKNNRRFVVHEWKIIDRHHEEHHLKLYEPDNETFPIALKYMDVMRQNQININSIFGKINDFGTAAEGVNLSEEWIGTRGFSILHTWLLDEFKWTNGRPTTNPRTSRPDSFRPEARISSCHHQQANYVAEWTKESVKLQAARRNRGIDKVWTDDIDYFKMIMALVWNWKRYDYAVYWEGWQQWRTWSNCNFNWWQWGPLRFTQKTSMR